MLALLLQPAQAHNWLFTPGRASTQASTLRPCQGRKSSDLHAQVGPNQMTTVKWATGHSRPSYFVVIKGEDYERLAHSDFTTFVNDYIDKAPAGNNKAQDPAFARYHGSKVHTTFYDTNALLGNKVLESSANFLNHS
jgi:hypothetical protein